MYSRYNIKSLIPLGITSCIAIVVWASFFPAFLNADSLSHYSQALSGKYEDWHPPFMAMALRLILKLGGSLGLVTLLQSLAGCLGIYMLARKILQLSHSSEKACNWLPLCLLLLLVSPLTPLPFHLMALVKDTWVALCFLWIGYLTLKTAEAKKAKGRLAWFWYGLLILFMYMSMLVRHNGIVLIPVYLLMLIYLSDYFMTTRNFRVMHILTCSFPLLLYFLISHSINNADEVVKTHPETQVIATESLGVLVGDIQNRMYLPYMYRHLSKVYKEAYIPGNVAPVVPWGPVKAVDSTFDLDNPELKTQYYSLITKAPVALLKVKWDGYAMMLKPDKDKWLFHPWVDENQYGFAQNGPFRKVGESWMNLTRILHSNTIVQYLFSEHLVWLFVNVFLIIYLWIKKRNTHEFLVALLLVPFAYYLSYFLASTGTDFRFMLPSTLFVEVVAGALIMDVIKTRRSANPVAGAPVIQ